MRKDLLDLLACPACMVSLRLTSLDERNERVIEGDLACEKCGASFPIRNGIPRFVPLENYASNFGFQWNRFRQTQLDSHSGEPISRERLHASTGWNWSAMKGKRILDVGCGSGRFAEVALQSGARVIGVDYSTAVDAALDNLRGYPEFDAVQASVYELPFWPHSFDYVYCLGVLQHTPDPAKAFSALPAQVVAGGAVAFDMYPRLWRNLLWSKYWLRPVTKRMRPAALMRLVERAVPYLLPLSRAVSAVPGIGKRLKYAIPVANYDGVYNLTEEQINEWAILDTFDMLSPEHDHPQTSETILQWCRAAGLRDIEVFRRGHLIARGVLPQ